MICMSSPSRYTKPGSGCCSCWCCCTWAPRCTTIFFCTTRHWRACCRRAARGPLPRSADMSRIPNPLRSGFVLAGLLAAASASAADYTQASGSTLAFATKYQGEVFVGKMPGFITRLRFDPARLQDARLDVTIPLAGVSIDNPDGTDTLKGREFFNVAQFPQARFAATRFRGLGGNRYAADGTLTLRGVSKPVSLEFTWTAGPQPVL